MMNNRFNAWCRHCRQNVRVSDRRFSTECPICTNIIPAETVEERSKREVAAVATVEKSEPSVPEDLNVTLGDEE